MNGWMKKLRDGQTLKIQYCIVRVDVSRKGCDV